MSLPRPTPPGKRGISQARNNLTLQIMYSGTADEEVFGACLHADEESNRTIELPYVQIAKIDTIATIHKEGYCSMYKRQLKTNFFGLPGLIAPHRAQGSTAQTRRQIAKTKTTQARRDDGGSALLHNRAAPNTQRAVEQSFNFRVGGLGPTHSSSRLRVYRNACSTR